MLKIIVLAFVILTQALCLHGLWRAYVGTWTWYRINGKRRLARSAQHAAEVHAKARARFGEPLDGRSAVTVTNSNGGVTVWRVKQGPRGGWKAEPWRRS